VKILVDGHVLDGPPQGTTTYIRGLYSNWPETCEVIIYCDEPQVIANKYDFGPNVELRKYSLNGRFFRLLVELPWLCWKTNADWLHVQYIAPIIKNCRVMTTTHDVLFLDFPQYFPRFISRLKGFLYFLTAKRADLVVTVSEYSKERIRCHFGIDSNIVVTPNHALASFALTESKVPELANLAFGLYVSRLEPRKNQHSLLTAFNSVAHRDKDAVLVFVGSKTIDYPAFEELLNDLDAAVKSRVKFLFPSDAELLWLYRNCSFFCYPSHCEGFGIPVLEARLAGSPLILCARNTALTELAPYVDYFFDSNDLVELTSLIDRAYLGALPVFRSPLKVDDWGESARHLYRQLCRVN
jgi:glycosyltransferase involved in cell wall biosynthesis